MNGLGVPVNVLAIIVAGGFGVMLRGKLKVRYQEMLLQAVGLAVILMGAVGLWDGFFVLENGQLETTGTMLVIFSLIVGWVFGEALCLEKGLDRLGHVFRRFTEREEQKDAAKGNKSTGKASTKTPAAPKANSKTEAPADIAQASAEGTASGTAGGAVAAGVLGGAVGGAIYAATHKEKRKRPKLSELPTHDLPVSRTGSLFADGFTMATIICAFNALAFNGTFADGWEGDHKLLFMKAAFDALIIFALATVYGLGVSYAALPTFLVEGIMLIFVNWKPELLTETLMRQLSLIGSVMLIIAGLNLLLGRKWKAANLIPALLIPPIYGLAIKLVEEAAEK